MGGASSSGGAPAGGGCDGIDASGECPGFPFPEAESINTLNSGLGIGVGAGCCGAQGNTGSLLLHTPEPLLIDYPVAGINCERYPNNRFTISIVTRTSWLNDGNTHTVLLHLPIDQVGSSRLLDFARPSPAEFDLRGSKNAYGFYIGGIPTNKSLTISGGQLWVKVGSDSVLEVRAAGLKLFDEELGGESNWTLDLAKRCDAPVSP